MPDSTEIVLCPGITATQEPGRISLFFIGREVCLAALPAGVVCNDICLQQPAEILALVQAQIPVVAPPTSGVIL